MNTPWTVHEVIEQTTSLLRAYAGPSDSRAQRLPDLRSFRYYAARGLIDAPLELRGRTALYGTRHIMQLVAIKRLQANGMRLGEIVVRFADASDEQLAQWAQLGADWSGLPPTAAQDGAALELQLSDNVTLRLEEIEQLPAHDKRRLLRAAQPLLHELARQKRRKIRQRRKREP